MQTSSIKDAILNRSSFSGANSIDIPTVLCNLVKDKEVSACLADNPAFNSYKELMEVGELIYSDNIGLYRNELVSNMKYLEEVNLFPDPDLVIKNHCKWLLTTLLDMVQFRHEANVLPYIAQHTIKVINGEVIDNYYGKKGIVLLGVYQNHIGFVLEELLKKYPISIIRKPLSDHMDSPLLGNFFNRVNPIDANATGGKKLFYHLKNKGIVGLYNDFIYPDSRPARGFLFGKNVNISETLLKIIEMTDAVIIPFSVVKNLSVNPVEVEIRYFDAVQKEQDGSSNLLFIVSLITEFLIRYQPEQWRLWNSLIHRWHYCQYKS